MPIKEANPPYETDESVLSKARWIFAQLGAREHFALARAALRQQQLAAVLTDFYPPSGQRALGYLLGGRRAADRAHADLPTQLVHACNMATITSRLRAWALPVPDSYLAFEREGRRFGRWAAEYLEQLDLGVGDAVFGYNTGMREILESTASQALFKVVGQIDPGMVEAELVQTEVNRWPGWARRSAPVPEAYWERLWAEWDAADCVAVNSDWSREALVSQGVPDKKLVVVPLAFEDAAVASAPGRMFVEPTRESPLEVLFFGQVTLRKGIAYLWEAAQLLRDTPVRFTVVGPLDVTHACVAAAPANVRVRGAVPRSAAARFYAAADVFVLPTLSDGFAITQLEAMAHGLPVITTEHCGRVVTDGTDGLLVKACSGKAIASAVRDLMSPEARERMSAAARATSSEFPLERPFGCLEDAHRRWSARA